VAPVWLPAGATVGAVARDVELGPLFTAGVILVAYGFLRRRPLAVAAGLGAVWLDQRSEFGRSLKRRIKSALKSQIKAQARG
jgi:hypothetical protein